MRKKADTFQVENPDKAMQNFRSLLGKLLKVPKSEIGTRKCPHAFKNVEI